jgi:FtsH-binding integral membrane protein
MKIVSTVYSEFGKTLLGVGQAILIATMIAKFFTKEPISWLTVVAGIVFSLAPTLWGLGLIQKAYYLRKTEVNSHE